MSPDNGRPILLFLSKDQIKALDKLRTKTAMESVALENHPSDATVVRATIWDRQSNHLTIDIAPTGIGTVIKNGA